MNKQRIAQILTVLILAGVLGGTLIKKNRWTFRTTRAAMRPADATPEDAIYSMLDAARKGDVQKYLASYSGTMQTSLRQSIAESSNTAFSQYLQDTNAALKGVAGLAPEMTSEPQANDSAGDGFPAPNASTNNYHGKY